MNICDTTVMRSKRIVFWDEQKACTVKIVGEYDQEIPQSQTVDNPMAPRGRAAQSSRDTRKTN